MDRFLTLNPEAWDKMGHTVLTIAVILIVGAVVLKFIGFALSLMASKNLISFPFFIFFQSALKWIAIIIVTLLILQQVGIPLNSVWAVISAIIAMVAIGFVAVWSVLSNLLCTLVLLIFHPFRIGDEVEIIDPVMTAGMRGKVRNINLMFTTLQENSGPSQEIMYVYVPNNLFFQKIIRCKGGVRTFSLDRQIFEEKSLLRANSAEIRDTETGS
ncbi:hypothetical protein DENIS_1116 [Desulfonema ishimotonii]|uniref:Mechanosensitive ion channel MscS domain-containing protein n=1 Tax=Desulfonema ishimotonii TaxID=45657 RepID=A0A401FT76_9BACT|nr:hypothetical protein DENIS_1116 [Desulfonema ishimotonii]